MTPSELTTRLANRKKFNDLVYPQYIKEAEAGNSNTLHITLKSMIYPTEYRYTQGNLSIEELEQDMHDFWFILIKSAKHIEGDRPEQDRLATLVQSIRELGVLRRSKDVGGEGKKEVVIEEAKTSDGRMWCDLPFMVGDFKAAWRDAMDSSFDEKQRVNLVAFIVKLVGMGIGNEDLAGCGLDIMKWVLETPRAFVRIPDAEELSINDLLPVLEAWCPANHKMLVHSSNRFESRSWNAVPGELAINAGVRDSGFSRERYLFWRKRLEELKGCDEEVVCTKARRLIHSMELQFVRDPAGVSWLGDWCRLLIEI